MKKIKKLFTSVAIVATLVIAIPRVAGYSYELQGAYNYAYVMGITTQPSIDDADMNGKLTRGAMAKMMVNYAEKVLGRTGDNSVSCNFNDIVSQSAEFQNYIIEACQLGLMGVDTNRNPVDSFNPNGIVTRAVFGTVLSRTLYGDRFNGGNPYYVNHLIALKNSVIMTDISFPNAPEERGYVMLMMKRAIDYDYPTYIKPVDCTSTINTLFCDGNNPSYYLNNCPVECKVTSIGNLNTFSTKENASKVSIQMITDLNQVFTGLIIPELAAPGARIYIKYMVYNADSESFYTYDDISFHKRFSDSPNMEPERTTSYAEQFNQLVSLVTTGTNIYIEGCNKYGCAGQSFTINRRQTQQEIQEHK